MKMVKTAQPKHAGDFTFFPHPYFQNELFHDIFPIKGIYREGKTSILKRQTAEYFYPWTRS